MKSLLCLYDGKNLTKSLLGLDISNWKHITTSSIGNIIKRAINIKSGTESIEEIDTKYRNTFPSIPRKYMKLKLINSKTGLNVSKTKKSLLSSKIIFPGQVLNDSYE